MKQQRSCSVILGAFLALAVISAQAEITWTGAAAGNNFWNPDNWSGGVPSTNTATTDNVVVTDAVGVTGTDSDLTLADGVKNLPQCENLNPALGLDAQPIYRKILARRANSYNFALCAADTNS